MPLVYTLAIRYLSKSTGMHSKVPAFIGDMGLLESMSNILKNRDLMVELTFFRPQDLRLIFPGIVNGWPFIVMNKYQPT